MTDNKTRNTALGGLAAALIVTVGSWFFIDRQTDRGLARLDLIDQAWKTCQLSYAEAHSIGDTSRIDARGLSVAVDSGKEGAPRRCGDLRRPDDAAAARDSANKAAELRDMMPSRSRP